MVWPKQLKFCLFSTKVDFSLKLWHEWRQAICFPSKNVGLLINIITSLFALYLSAPHQIALKIKCHTFSKVRSLCFDRAQLTFFFFFPQCTFSSSALKNVILKLLKHSKYLWVIAFRAGLKWLFIIILDLLLIFHLNEIYRISEIWEYCNSQIVLLLIKLLQKIEITHIS